MQVSINIPNPAKALKRKIQDRFIGEIFQDTTGNIWGLDSFPHSHFKDGQLAFNLVSRLANLGYDINFAHDNYKSVEKFTKEAKSQLEVLAGKYDKSGKLIQEGELQKSGTRLAEFLADGGKYRRLNGDFTRAQDAMIEEWFSVESAAMDKLFVAISRQTEIYTLLSAYLENLYPLK